MILRSIELQNFRNYENLSLTFSEGTNIFYGDNAQGKTNLLEAVYMSGTTKSHRGNRDRDMIRFGQDEAHIRTNVKKSGHEEQIDIHLRKTKSKGIAVNHFPIKKASDLFGILNLIFFSPEDLNIIKDGPAERRRFMDQELCQLDKIYLSDLKNYNKALDQRNQLLKDVIKNMANKNLSKSTYESVGLGEYYNLKSLMSLSQGITKYNQNNSAFSIAKAGISMSNFTIKV